MLIVSLILFLIIIFLGLIFILRGIMAKNVILATKHLEDLSQDYARKEKEISARLEEVKQKSQESLARAQEDAEKQKAQIVKESQEEKAQTISAAQQKADEMIQQADRACKALLEDIEQKIEEKAIQQAVQLLQQVLPERIRQEIHLRWLEDLVSGSFQQLERLRLTEGIRQARVVSAFTLSASQREALNSKLKEKLGYSVELKEELDANVIAGLVVNIGNLVFDGSLRSEIQKIAYAK